MAQFGTIADWLNYDKIRMASAKRNLVGEGIGEAFTGIAQIVGEKIDGKKKEKGKEVEENLLEKVKAAVPPAEISVDGFTFPAEEVILQTAKERPANDPNAIKNDPEPVNVPATELAQLEPIDLSINTNIPTDRTFDTFDYSTQNYGGVLNISESTKNAANKKKNQATYAQEQLMQFLLPSDQACGPSPFPRRRAVGVQGGTLIETAEREQQNYQQRRYDPATDPYLDEQGRAEMIDSPGFIGSAGAFAEGYNMRIKRASYARKAFDKSQKGLEDVFSQLQIGSSGVDSIDASTDIMAHQAKKAFVELESNKYNMDPAEYIAAKESILAQPKLIGQSMTVLKQRVDDFIENRHLLSKGNNPETLDLLDSLSKNEGAIQPVMRDGKAYLVGKTSSGKDVDVPLSEIANGRNDFKFLTRFDPSETLNTMVTKYGKIKKDAEFRTSTGVGVESKILPISAFEKDVRSDLNKMLADENILRSVVADYLNADFDTFEEIKAAGLDPKTLAVNELYNQFSVKFDPVSKQRDIQSYQSIDPAERAIKLQSLKQKASGGGKSSSNQSLSETFSDPNFYNSFESPEGITPDVIKSVIGADAVVDEDNPNFLVIQDPSAPNQEIRISRKGPRARKNAINTLLQQVYKKDISQIKITPPVQSTGGPKQQFTLPKKQE